MAEPLRPADVGKVQFNPGYLADRVNVNRAVTLPIEHRHCRDTGRLDAWQWTAGQPNRPHQFWDSDVAKWIEAAAYSLASERDPDLEARIDAVVEAMAEAQQPDGYLNSFFIRVAPDKRWTNLRDMHELYCAGHLMEAAVAYADATGKRAFLDIICRYADAIRRKFGPAENQRHGFPGHEEIELALIKLYRTTGRQRYLDLAQYFVDQRGRKPHAFDQEAKARGEDPGTYRHPTYEYCQAHQPVKEQRSAEGHSVRACYLYAGMADVATETDDPELLHACRQIWDNIVTRRMYITGGIGSTQHGERFTVDYDLPNETAYAETCAAIALMFFAQRMLQIERSAGYADIMERALYNGVLSGVSLDGTRFFYANPLAVYPPAHPFHNSRFSAQRQEWFGCACCPPNIARLIASLGRYAYSSAPGEAWVHLYAAGQATLDLETTTVTLQVNTDYPWDGRVVITVDVPEPGEFTLALRIPGWCSQADLQIGDQPAEAAAVDSDGYCNVARSWNAGDTVTLNLDMPVQRLQAHPAVRQNAGCVALQRGPVVYCLEETDNGPHLGAVILPEDSTPAATTDGSPFPGVPVIKADARRDDIDAWSGKHALYQPSEACPPPTPASILAVPYALWANRAPGEMRVWIRQA